MAQGTQLSGKDGKNSSDGTDGIMDDLKNIRISANSNRLLEDLVEQEYFFSNSLAAYQLAVTVAIIKKCEFDIDSIEDRQNKYGVSSFDGDANV